MHILLLIIIARLCALVFGEVTSLQHTQLYYNLTDGSKSSFEAAELLPDLAHPEPQVAWHGVPPAPASDEIWKRFVCKGTKMMAQMSWSDYDVGQALPKPQVTAKSPFETADLWAWGYHMYGTNENFQDYSEGGYWGIAPWLRGAGISDKSKEYGGKWQSAMILHSSLPHEDDKTVPIPKESQRYTGPDGVSRRVTGAKFYMSVTPEGGIMTQDRKGPWDALKELHPWDYSQNELPELQKSSDMMWIMYKFFVPADRRRHLQFFITLTIENPTTLSLIRRALNARGKQLTARGERFEMDTDMGKALLASPNGAGFAHLLIQRKEDAGLKTIDSVWVFECASRSKSPCMWFTTAELAQAVLRTPDPPTDPNASPAPDPNNGPNSNSNYDISPPIVGGGGSSLEERARLKKRSVVRQHIFHFNGNVTVSSDYL